ncbi:MAG: hypothetical protein ACUVXJ_03220 [Phycisphaerae bacterium]
MVSIRRQIAACSRRTGFVNMAAGRIGLAAVMVPLLWTAACNTVPGEKFQAVQRDLLASQERTRQLEGELAAQQETNRDLGKQIANLSRFGDTSNDVLIIPERIRLASMSGGYDDDGKAGDDGIVVYIQPIDRDQHVVKAAGTIKVRLLDPQNPPDRAVFAEYYFDLEHTRALWYGRLMTHHFSVKCPWPAGHLPAHNEIVAHVIFTDLLSGKSLTATGTFNVRFAPQETRPAGE